MPTISVTLTATNQDGHGTLNGSSSIWDVNNGINNAAPFFGPNGNNPYCGYFCFKVDGLAQGARLTNVRLTLYFEGSGGYTNGSSSRIYIAVENNLLTEPDVGTGSIVRGVKGKSGWDRLGRIAEAVTAFGNRTGPTHSHPSGLAN